ncbi:twin-arginine translocation signal domain-containing protein [Tunicatimonas pelagia]|uniref:twin-arginine translocation signal domain-containing protein n=1 Tax=Tunicatimonas pelagia TaxID=931531 RepID=UPI0026669943|nr:twin-arginine translocation signal domain-containing protein [Tunicatimonas pelagia]WKN44996.1 twin-arginine translocation signal domain-containing protein [Tunicatimonas pelagia]
MKTIQKTIPEDKSRRSFIKQSALAGALLAIHPYDLLAKRGQVASSHLTAAPAHRYTPVAIVWDAANLMIKDADIAWKMKDSISEQFNKMVAGQVLDRGLPYISEILTIIQGGSGWSEEIHPQVALVAGWLVYRETAKVMNAQDTSPDQILRQDVAVLKHTIGKSSSASPSAADVEDILKLLYHRATFRTHTLTPDTENWNEWVINYMDWYREDRQRMQSLARAWVSGEEASTDFFNPNDELIKIASDYSVSQIRLNESFVEGKGSSAYTQALAQSALALKSLDEFFKGNMSKSAFMQKHEIA